MFAQFSSFGGLFDNTVTKNIAWNDRVTDNMAKVVVSSKYYTGTGIDIENDHKIYKLFAVLADSKQNLPLPSCSAVNGTVIMRSARTTAGILKFIGTAHFRHTAGGASADRLGCTVSHSGYNLR